MKCELTAKRLREVLAEIGLTQQELHEKSGVSKSSISQYVNGSHSPSNISSGKMAKVLHVNPLWLMGYNAKKECEQEIPVIHSMELSTHEHKVIMAYRNQPEMQPAVDRILGISASDSSHLTTVAAHEISGSSEEDKRHDDEIMKDDNF